jgi:hypothetical protein
LAGVVAGPADEARTFQTLTAGGFATGLGAGGGAGTSGTIVAAAAVSPDVVSSGAVSSSSPANIVDGAPAVGAASADALTVADGSAAAEGSPDAGSGSCGLDSSVLTVSTVVVGVVVVNVASSAISLAAVVDDEAAVASAFLGPLLAGDGPVLPPSLAGPAFFSPCRCAGLSPFSFSTRRALGWPAPFSSLRRQSTERLDALRDVVTVVKGCSSKSLAEAAAPAPPPVDRCELPLTLLPPPDALVVDVPPADLPVPRGDGPLGRLDDVALLDEAAALDAGAAGC